MAVLKEPAVVRDERVGSNGRVADAGGVVIKRQIPISDVFITVDVKAEGAVTRSRIEVADGIFIQRHHSHCCITGAGCILEERIGTKGRVVTGGIIVKCVIPSRCVTDPGNVVVKRSRSDGHVAGAGSGMEERTVAVPTSR